MAQSIYALVHLAPANCTNFVRSTGFLVQFQRPLFN